MRSRWHLPHWGAVMIRAQAYIQSTYSNMSAILISSHKSGGQWGQRPWGQLCHQSALRHQAGHFHRWDDGLEAITSQYSKHADPMSLPSLSRLYGSAPWNAGSERDAGRGVGTRYTCQEHGSQGQHLRGSRSRRGGKLNGKAAATLTSSRLQ